jgi:pimeloyl-ACP methyl ester carboxylesterase
MKRFFIYTIILTGILLFLSRCVLCKMRWSDSKARRVFKSKNVPLTIHDTLIDDRHVHYAMAGNKNLPSLIFIHGSPGSWFHYYRFMCDPDLLKKYRIISFDRPGFGHSDYGRAMHLQDQARLLLSVLQSLQNDQPMILCGHSLGGPLVAKLAADAPQLFSRLVIVAGSLDPSLEEKETWRHVMNNRPLNWFLPGVFQTSNTELLYLKGDLKPLGADLSRITAQVLFIHGDKDNWVPIANIAYGQAMMVNARSIRADTLKGADHNFPWNRREEFIKFLLNLDQE